MFYTYIHIYQLILPHPWSVDSQGQETLLAPSADSQNSNYDTECYLSVTPRIYLNLSPSYFHNKILPIHFGNFYPLLLPFLLSSFLK